MGKIALPVLAVILMVALQFGFMFLLLGLLPSFVAYFIDRERGKLTFQVVCACNIAAVLPPLSPILQGAIHLKHVDAASVLMDPMAWLIVYSGAAIGWCAIYLCRFVARFIYAVFYEYQITSLESQQKQLLEEWGQQIMQPPEEP